MARRVEHRYHELRRELGLPPNENCSHGINDAVYMRSDDEEKHTIASIFFARNASWYVTARLEFIIATVTSATEIPGWFARHCDIELCALLWRPVPYQEARTSGALDIMTAVELALDMRSTFRCHHATSKRMLDRFRKYTWRGMRLQVVDEDVGRFLEWGGRLSSPPQVSKDEDNDA